jgi:hypothetical protein
MTTVSGINQALKQDVAGLEQKRQVLEQIVDITRAIETMQESLDAVLLMGVASSDLPQEALKKDSSLNESLHNLSLNRIKEYYSNLELIVNKQLNRILNYSGINFSNDEQVEFITLSSEKDAQSPVEMLNAFKRTAQTAISLRVLLRKGGVSTPGSALPASNEILRQHLCHLSEQERAQRVRIKNKIVEMKGDLSCMIGNPNYRKSMKEMLRGVAGNLDKDLLLLERGAPVGCLSFIAETKGIEMEAALPVESSPKPKFSEAAVRWLNSPWDVSWDDVTQ